MKRKITKIIVVLAGIFLVFSLLAFIGIHIAYEKVFSKAAYQEYDTSKFLTYNDVKDSYKRETLKINSGKNKLTGYLYGATNTKGLIVVSPGHRDCNDIKLYEIMSFVDAGWSVLCYDYTGCFTSEGDSMVSYTQSVTDLDNVLRYVESEKRFANLPTMLFGHSLGGYASAAVLKYNHAIKAVISASGFDNPTEQWEYSIQRFTGIFGNVLRPYAKIYIGLRLGDQAHLSAIDSINATKVPVLVFSGTNDEYYGSESKIYERRSSITNPNCEFRLMSAKNHRGHYDYFLTDAAIQYQNQIKSETVKKQVNKTLYMEHDKNLMNTINNFYLSAIKVK